MAIRAYRVIQIVKDRHPTFSFSSDEKLVDFLDRNSNFCDELGSTATGLTEVPVEVLKQALQELDLEPETKQALEKDIERARCLEQEFIQYYCY